MEPGKAIENYIKAARLDPMNGNHHAELADIYSRMAYSSETENERKDWMEQAIREGEEAVRLDRYYPYYNKILTDVYFSGGQNIKACEQALKLVLVQPRVSGNYELLARGYLEAGLQYIINEETGRISENVKYKGVPWMGMVKLTPVYKEIKQIINVGIL
ncbi:MAG: tetratricopeptide repeat protein [Clostridia bacterium]